MPKQNKIWKKKATKDGRNAKQRRADEKQAKRLASGAHLTEVAKDLKHRIFHQSNRWVDHHMRTGEIVGYQNEIRWGISTGNTHYMSDEAQHAIERLDRERREALDRLNKTKAAATPGIVPELEVWVDDWFGQAIAGGVSETGASTAVGIAAGSGTAFGEEGGLKMEQDRVDGEEEKMSEGEDDKGEDSDCMSGVEMG